MLPHKKIQSWQKFALFLSVILTLKSCQGHDTLSGHNQSFYEVKTSNGFSNERNGPDINFVTFPACDFDLARKTLGHGHDIPRGHNQSLCEVKTSYGSP